MQLELPFIILAFVIVLFAGLAFMFLGILRGQERMLKILLEDNESLRTHLEALEKLLAGKKQYDLSPNAAPSVPAPDNKAYLMLDLAEPPENLRSSASPDRLDLDTGEDNNKNKGMPDLKI